MSAFEECTAWLGEKAGVASIDWQKLAAQKKDSVRNPAYLVEYLLPAYERAQKVRDSLATLQTKPPAEIIEAYVQVKSESASHLRKAFEIGNMAAKFWNVIEVMKMQIAVGHAFVYALWMQTLENASLHVSGTIHRSDLTDEEIAYHASLTTMMFNLFVMLDQVGLFRSLDMKGSVSGLGRYRGGLGAAPVGVFVLGAVVVIAFAWAAVAMYQTQKSSEVAMLFCKKAAESGDPADMARCQQMQANAKMPEFPGSDTLSKVVEKVAIAAMIGAAGYALVIFGPGIATNLKKTMAAWKAA